MVVISVPISDYLIANIANNFALLCVHSPFVANSACKARKFLTTNCAWLWIVQIVLMSLHELFEDHFITNLAIFNLLLAAVVDQ